ncbi:PIN-like domain-containing protein [Microcoleus sp. herbarium2]|uniref:PIN-like domain-containing protein n=1 Tax=Microcoleus sp. herbarium2 TaxID=3055433 RepID=UPI0040409869
MGLVCGSWRLSVCARFATGRRERFFKFLNRLKKKIWISYQAAYEYQKNRL